MENRPERYNFSGFVFGSEDFYNLTIRLNNFAGYGTSYTSEVTLELTQDERLALIKLLINAERTDKETI